MLNRACTPPRQSTPPARNALPGAVVFSPFVEMNINVDPPKKPCRVERRLGLGDEDEEEQDSSSCTEVVSNTFSTPRGSWPLSAAAQPVRAPSSDESALDIKNELVDVPNRVPAAASMEAVSATPVVDASVLGERREAAVAVAPSALPQSCETPQTTRSGSGRLTGGSYGLPLVHSLLYTPQIAPSKLALRRCLDAELDEVNKASRMLPLPAVTPLISGKLFVGGFPDEETVAILRKEGVRHIINCASRDYVTDPSIASEFVTHELDAFDSAEYLILHHDLEPFTRLVDDIIERQGQKVFVHCIAGINRSVTLCCAYLMEKLHANPIEVVQLLRKNGRMRILENIGFRHQLVDHYIHVVERMASNNEEEEESREALR